MEDATTEFTSVKLDSYYGLRLSTLPSTKIDQSEKKGMLIGTSTICRQKQKHGFAHSLIPLKLINMC